MKQQFRNMSIRYKFAIAFIFILSTLVLLILISANIILYRFDIARMKAISQDECEIIQVRLDTIWSNLVTCSKMLTKDINQVYQEEQLNDTSNVSFVSIKNRLYSTLDYNKRCFPEIHSILFVDRNKNMVTNGLDANPDYPILKQEFLSKINDTGLANCVDFPLGRREFFDDKEQVLTFGKRIIQIETGEILGYILINVSEQAISKIFPDKENMTLQRLFYLADQQGTIVSANDKKLLGRRIHLKIRAGFLNDPRDCSQIMRMDKKPYLITRKATTAMSWTLISQTSVSELTRGIRDTSRIIMILGAAGAAAAMVLVFALSGWITKPVHQLTAAAQAIWEGDFTVKCEAAAADEVGVLSRAFNTMTCKIDRLIQEVKREQTRKREFELALIQAQIKPHFLYNALDLIYVFCESGKSDKSALLTKALADFYRTALSSGQEIVSIKEEIKNIENYLYIQRERYCDFIDFEITVAWHIEDLLIPKMTLQPLIENAIYHGLRDKGKKGIITVTGRMEAGTVVLQIADNGAGMSADRVLAIFSGQEEAYGRHFGLRSVRERLKLYYGEKAEVVIESQAGEGTRVIMRIPKNGRGDC